MGKRLSSDIVIRQAEKRHAQEIARLIMTAMTDECCLYYCADFLCWLQIRKRQPVGRT